MEARTPEELETLFEDALLLHDGVALAELFAPGAVLAVGDGAPTRGAAIPETALAVWGDGCPYVADPRQVLAARDVALIDTGRGINVARRTRDGGWRYVIVRQRVVAIDGGNGKERSSWS